MTVRDDREVSERLGRLLDGIDPRPAPVGGAVRQGRGIRMRRRVSVAAGLAVVAGGAVLVPTVLHAQRTTPPAAPRTHYRVTVSPPGKGAKRGVIATGSVNGWRWQATLEGGGNDVAVLFGTDFSLMSLGQVSFADGDLASFEGAADGSGHYGYVGPVAGDVRQLTVSLSDGEVLVLRPQEWAGHRFVAMVLPEKLSVLDSVAYGSSGEVGYAIPFNYRGSATFQTWLRPGQAGQQRVTSRIGSGGSGRSRWVATAYVGPWGLCMEVAGGRTWLFGGCIPVGPPVSSGLVSGLSGGGAVDIGVARSDVSYLLIARSGGSVLRAGVAHVAGLPYGLFVLSTSHWRSMLSWAAYDGRGTRLGGGKGDPVGFR